MFEYFDAAGNATSEGVYVPVGDLASLQAAELAAAEPANLKFGKVLNALMVALTGAADIATALGFAPSLGDIAGAGGSNFTRTFTFQWQKYVNHKLGTLGAIPVPTVGTLTGVGALSIADVFPNAAKVAAAGAVAGAGIVIQTQAITALVPVTHADVNIAADSRLWFMGLSEALVTAAVVRTAAISSPVNAKSRPSVSSPTIPAEFVQATNPTTGIDPAALDYSSLAQRVLSLTLSYQVSPSGETFDVITATT